MITRIVKLTFRPEEIEKFEALFASNREFIASFPGCSGVQLHRDSTRAEVYFTLSEWNSAEDLENYRKSDLFERVWADTKVLFAGKPEAWTLNMING